MDYKIKVIYRREKVFDGFVSIDGENVLTKNVSLSNVVAPMEIH